MAIAFATVYRHYLIIPVGSIFGAKNSPSFYMLSGELRAHYAMHLPLADDQPLTALATRVKLLPPPTAREVRDFAQATPDTTHSGIAGAGTSNPERRLNSFVDDSSNAHVWHHILPTINASVMAAYVVFGAPEENPRRPPSINPHKWTDQAHYLITFLGYQVDSRRMIVIWPVEKRLRLRRWLDRSLPLTTDIHVLTPREITQLLGLIQHGD